MASSTTTRSMLFLAFCGASFAAEDSSVMIQHSSLVLTRDVPDPGPDGFLMDRLHSYAEPGSRLEVVLGSKCAELDEGGSKQCSVRWGDLLKGFCKIHIPGGLRSGETLVNSVSMHMRPTNLSDPGATLIPSSMDVVSRCQLCGGSCVLKAQTPVVRFFLSLPTLLDDRVRCASGQYESSEDFTLFDINASMPSLANLMLDGTVTLGLGLLKADGTKRLEGSYSIKAKARQSSPAQTPVSLVVSFLAKRFANALTEEQKGTLRQAVELTHGSAPVQHEGPAVLGLDLTMKTVENLDTSLTLTSEKCSNIGLRSVKCKIPVQSNFDLGGALRLKGNFDEGSMVKIKLTPSIGGVMGNVMGSMLAPIAIELPLCGKAADVVIAGQTFRFQPPKCGNYELRLETQKLPSLSIPDIFSIALPPVPGMTFMPKTLSEVLPLSIDLSVDIMHADMKPMLSAEVTLSAGH